MTLQAMQEHVRNLALHYHAKHNWFFLGRGIYTPIALEGALKKRNRSGVVKKRRAVSLPGEVGDGRLKS